MNDAIARLLPSVRNPVQYLGREINACRKERTGRSVAVALGYPDLYGIGMSSLGLRILYGLLNGLPDVVCERFFMPEPDMEAILRRGGTPLFALESGDPVRTFDIVGVSLSSELNYTNLLAILDLAGIPPRSADRSDADPIVLVGGNSALNPAPLAPFVDAFLIGEGEEAFPEIVEAVRASRGMARGERLRAVAAVAGVYVPLLPAERVVRRFVADLDGAFFPEKWIVPLTEIVHDRISLEIMRGCAQGCRFCQAGRCWRPARARSAGRVLELAEAAYANSGYEEISLLSFSSGDHPAIGEIVGGLVDRFRGRRVAFSFPSLRIDTFSFQLASKIREIRRTGLTFAPETGERLRRSVGKAIGDGDLLSHAAAARAAGWRQIKLYFMIGLPGETEADLDDACRLIAEISRIVAVKAAFNTFVPKAHTPLERAGFLSEDEYLHRRRFIRSRLDRSRFAAVSFHPWEMSCVEALLGRGGPALAPVVERARALGAGMENWSESFDFGLWRRALEDEGLDPAALLGEAVETVPPWHFIEI